MLDAANGKEKATVIGHSARRINYFARAHNAQSYLEIGVANGSTFINVEVSHKDAVDPKFRFDYHEMESQSIRFYEMPSNEFFLDSAEQNTKYDIIFLDGLHTFEQTFRDFCALQRHCHNDTIWLIDDVYPSDIFSAHPDQSRAFKYRRRHSLSNCSWHGDVFKVIFAINDFFPNYTYKTIRSKGNPQTVLVRRPRVPFNPFFNNFETISRLSYFEFYENREMLHLETEEGVFEWIGNVLRDRKVVA